MRRQRNAAFEPLRQPRSPAQPPAAAAPRRAGALPAASATARRQPQRDTRPITVVQVNATGLVNSIGRAGKIVRRLAQRLARSARSTRKTQTQLHSEAPLALHIPRNYGWPLGLFARKSLARVAPDQAYEEAFATHHAFVSKSVAESAVHRFGHTHIDDDSLRAQLHAWANGTDGSPDDGKDPFHDGPVLDDSSSTTSHESEIQPVASPANDGRSTTTTHEAGPGTTRRVHFAPEVETREFSPETHEVPTQGRTVPLHGAERGLSKPKGHVPEDPSLRELYRERSVNRAAWDTLSRLKSPRYGATDKKMTAQMLEQGKLLFAIKKEYKLSEQDEQAAIQKLRELEREVKPPSFALRVRGLVRQLRGKGPLPGRISIPGEDTRSETLARSETR
ncbi:hypothetical protein C0Z17_09510 [Trinickia caryophylli]|nr:hypothetical protein C0Z17_09510 [Trinickia caryophylli]